MPQIDPAQLEAILEYLRQTRGFDFTAYKRPSLIRRILKRMHAVGVSTFEEYLDYLQVHQHEFGELFNTILINVTSFFRDREIWTFLAGEILPGLLAGRTDGRPLRLWSAGCASGEEPYSLAMLLAEHTGAEALRDRVKIYATDVDEGALSEARLATYSPRLVEDVPPELLERYFHQTSSGYAVNPDIRRAVIFGRHDLLQDAPISKIDLLLCRNTLMYFNTDAQARILARFYFSLKPGGYLLLGRAEMLFSHGAIFSAVDFKKRLFRTVPDASHRDRLLLFAHTGRDVASQAPLVARLRETAFESDPVPQIIVDPDGALAAVNNAARQRFGIRSLDIGHPLHELDVASALAELRPLVERAARERVSVLLKDLQWSLDGDTRYFEINAQPLFDDAEQPVGTCVSFHDITDVRALQRELQRSKHDLETAFEELQSTNEELETTNEELQSTVEELETTNEELQSTNEELETMNEELQSTNEELQTINEELRTRSTEHNSANAFLESVFASLRSAVVVVDPEFRVQVWNGRAEDLWGLRADEAENAHLLGLDIGLPLAELKQSVRDVLNGHSPQAELTLAATNRRGKPIECRITIAPLAAPEGGVRGAILLMEDRPSGGDGATTP